MKRVAVPKPLWARWLFILILFSGLILQILFSSTLLIAEAFTNQGMAAQNELYPEIALKSYERACRWNDHNPHLLYLLGVLRHQLGKDEAATEALARSFDLAPHEIPTLIAYAERRAFSGDMQHAENMIERAVALAPNNWRTEQVAGLVRGLQRDHAGAAAHFKRAVKLSGQPEAGLLNNLANALYEQGGPAQALRYADRALKLQELHPDHHLVRGKALLALERIDEAHNALSWAERIYSKRVSENLPEQGKLDMARRYLVQALIARKRPDRAIEVLFSLADSQGPTDEVTALARELQIALDTLGRHQDSVAQFNLGKVMMIISDYEAADAALARAPSGLPKEEKVACVILRAQTLFQLRRPQEALKVLQALPQQDRLGPEYAITLADALAATGQLSAARQEYTDLLQEFSLPDHLRDRVETRRDALPSQ